MDSEVFAGGNGVLGGWVLPEGMVTSNDFIMDIRLEVGEAWVRFLNLQSLHDLHLSLHVLQP